MKADKLSKENLTKTYKLGGNQVSKTVTHSIKQVLGRFIHKDPCLSAFGIFFLAGRLSEMIDGRDEERKKHHK